MSEQEPENSALEGIAVVGLAGRFPGADDLAELWRNLCGGVEAITFYTREELEAAGVSADLLDDPRYVRAGAALRDVRGFDAPFFGFSAREAELMDPQNRIFLECCWEALENAGYDTASYPGAVGIFAGMGMSSYLIQNLLTHRDLIHGAGPLQVRILNDSNYLTALAAYKLDLRGPSVTVQSACSTSLVATCMACQSLLQFQCDMVLAGGVSVVVPHARGYLAQESVLSPDGHCRAFDADARGTVEGSGAGVVVLKRLSDAIADGDTIHAVIRGFATNNDGGFKMSFTAPSLDGQVEVLAMAQAMAGVPARSITYVEAHGTGTPLGDPVEVAALTEVFGAGGSAPFCALGSIKTNLGHLDAAAGIAGLLKAILAVEHGVLPPSLHFERPNPRIDFARSPFYVNTACRPWTPEGWPRRAGVSAFAIGGVNAHVIVEEPPAAPEPVDPASPWHLLTLSARTESALEAVTDRLLGHLRATPPAAAGLADIAWTLQVGRRAFAHRRVLVCRDAAEAVGLLERRDPRRLLTGTAPAGEPQVAFLFPGLGTQYAGMARGLYRDDAGFRARLDDCAERLAPLLGLDLREALFPEGDEEAPGEAGVDLRGLLGRGSRSASAEDAERRLRRTALSQPAVFAVEYALAGRLMDWGIRPQAMLGFSIGEYVAACLAGVLSLDDALRLVAGRARLIDALPPGAMLAVPLGEAAVAPWLAPGLSLAAVAGQDLTVLAGTEPAVAAVEERLTAAGHVCRRLQTTHAFHSDLMEPVVESFLALFAGIELQPPALPYLSNVTGTWITDEQATDPAYWVEHLRGTVRFAEALGTLGGEPGRVFLEVGPGQTLSSWALQHPASTGAAALPTLRHAFERTDDLAFLLQSVGRLWLSGLRLDAQALWADQARRRVPLPTYPFERRPYWIEPRAEAAADARPAAVPERSHGSAAPAAETARQHPRPSLHNPYAAPRDATERRLVAILGELLHLDEVGIHDSFFDLGGDSLLATHLVARLNRELGSALTLRTVFEAPTAAELAAAAVRPEAGSGVWGPVARREPGAATPLSSAQRRLWFLDQLAPGDPAYNVPAAVLLTGRLDRAVLAAALDEVVARHEALRTTFDPADDEAVQRIVPPFPVPFPGIDLAALPESPRDAEARRLAAEEALRPFELSRGPLLRAALLRLGADRHVALFTLHHMVGDGWSSDLLVRELAALYPALAAGRPSPLAPLPVQYADFVLWQRANLQGAELDQQLAFWRGALAGAPAALELPADRPRPPQASGRGGLVWAPLAATVTESLEALGRRSGATPFMTLLAAFFALLHRLTGEADLVVGTPIAGRRRPELEGLIGFFANTLALRAAVPAEAPTFAGLLAAVRAAALSAYDHQDLPFERLVEELAPRRSLAHTPLFQVMFLRHGTPLRDLGLPGLALAPFGGLSAEGRAAKFDLTLEIVEGEEGLLALLEHRRDLFDLTTAARLLGHFSVLVDALGTAPAARLAELPLLTAAERHQLSVEWSAPAGGGEAGAGDGLHAAFEAQAVARPGAPAVVARDATLTYGELAARAGRLARHLRHLGVGPEVPVAVCAERSADLVVALLAVLQAGGAYLPLDPGYPRERLGFLLEDAAAPVLVAPGRFADLLPAGARRVALDAPETWSSGREDLPTGTLPGQLAYLIYTSGSTGRPKGVAIPHAAAVALVRWAAAAFSAEELGGVLASTSICFDLSVFELFVPLSLGGMVLLAENALELPRLAAAGAVRLINTVPSAMGELVRQGAIPPSVRTVGLAGEPLRRDLVEAIHAAAPGVERVLNLYGPSETTTYSTWTAVARGAAGEPAIGRPIAGTRAYVLSGALEPVPVGVPGELFLGGAGLARGYLGRPGLTAERWLPDPFGTAAGGRLYRTGDRVRLRPDGLLDLLGRADAQVKVRGFRIEPGEIEAALTALPAVAQAAVVAREDGGDRRLVAWVVAQPGAEVAAAGLRTALHERLPEFMVPGVFVVVDELPLTANGKVDRGALVRRPLADSAAAAAVEEEALSPLEEGIAAIFAEVLGCGRVGRRESFFDLGGHSLLATRVVSRLRAAFGAELSIRKLFEAPTVALLAAEVAAALRGGAPAPPALVPREPRAGGWPLSFAQQRLWFLDQLEPGRATYNVPATTHFRGLLDVAALAAALREVVARHAALRTTFAASGDGTGEPLQHVAPPPAPGLPLIDLSGLPEAPRAGEAARLVREEAARPFDLARGPLVRGALARLGASEHLGLFTLHHIVADGWSAGVLIRELAVLLPELAAGRPSPLPPLPVQYTDFAVWQREWLQGPALAGLLRSWRDRLDGAASLDLPTDRPYPAVPSGRGGVRTALLPAGTGAGLAALSRSAAATRFIVLLAAWKALLHRLTGQTDLLVGTPVANRGRIEIEGLIGFFANTLVLRTDLRSPGEGLSFRALLGRVREAALSAYAHQDLPFEQLVEELAPERNLARAPLFQTLFVLQDLPWRPVELPGLTLTPVTPPGETAKFDLTLFVAETDEGLQASLEYSSDLFAAATAQRILGSYATLLAAALAEPDARLGGLSWLSEAERHQLCAEWNATRVLPVPEVCVHELFEAWADRAPQRMALLVLDAEGRTLGSLTYGEVERRANRLAHRLLKAGAGPETPVGVCLERGAEAAVSLLAVLKAGACHLPLDPAYPMERLAFMLADAGAPVVIARDGAALPVRGARVVVPGEEEDGAEARRPAGGAQADHLAYLIYTSGSTGRPKGVALPHRVLSNLIAWQAGASVAADGRTVQLASPSFDVSLQEVFATWGAGGTLVVVPEEARRDAAGLLRLLRDAAVERLFLPFVALQQLAEAAAGAAGRPDSLREVMTAGEALQITPEIAAFFAARPGCVLHNQYGPSETHVVTQLTLPGRPDGWSVLPTIGRPVANTAIHLLDREGHPVPIGVPGEVCIAGAGLARGYLGRPDLTAERFVPSPWGRGERLYRSGDLARLQPDGEIEFLGRIDRQVKIRGFRVEVGEVEAALALHPAVREAVVVVRGEGAARHLVAWVVPVDQDLPERELRAALAARLPDYMVPAVIAPIAELPLTPSGKVDRLALSRRESQPGRPGAVPAVAPRTPVEEALTGIWAETLGVSGVGADDDFFALGGHSLLATRAVSRVRRTFGIDLGVRVLFESPTPARLAEAVEAALRAGGATYTVPLAPRPAAAHPAPLSFAQQRLWFLDQLEPGSSLYNIPLKVELRGRLDPGVLSAALGEVVRRHEVLRTRFERGAEGPVQVVEAAVPRALALADLGALPQPVRLREEARLTGEEARRPFDLARGPLLRTLLLRRGEDDWALVLSMHHAVSDGWSLGVLVRELGLLYPSFLAGRPSPLPEPAIQYADFAVWQRRHLAGERLAAEVSWWRGQLAGMPQALDLPADRPRPAALSDRGASHSFLVAPETLGGLAQLARRQGATLYMTLLAAFAALLQRVGDGSPEDVGIGSPVAGRTRVETEPLIGFFVNLLVLRVDLAEDPAGAALLDRVRETTLAAYAHQELPFERLVEELAVERDRSRAPLVQVMLALQNTPAGPLELPGLELEAVALPSGTAKLDLTMALGETAAGLRGDVESSRDLFDGATVERLIGRFVRLLDGIVADPHRRLSELPLLSAAEHQQALVEGNDTAVAFPREACLAELFAAIAGSRPEAPALVVPGDGESPGAVWSYGRLGAAANRLARRLRSLGVGPQTPVCIAMERSAELIVGILAIVQAGGLYVPLDAGYPDERLAFMLADVGAEIVLVHAATRDRLAGRARQVFVEDDEDGMEVESGPLGVRVPAESAAYVIYTSGSTGLPKGVAVPQRAIVRLVRETDYVRLGPGDRVAQLANISFDAATWEIWGALLNGATVVVVPREVVLSAPGLAALLGAQAITSLFLTTALFNRLAQEAPGAFAGVRDVLFGGEAADPAMARAVLAAGPPRRLLHVYGPTESTTFASWHLLRAVPAGALSLPIGAPPANTTLYVVDRRLTAVPPGTAGELLIGGDGLAWGYWNRPELTAERFVPDPWTAGGRLYRTGDLVRRPVSGALEFLGRIDQQVKIRGFRIEPGEIEAALLAHPRVRAAVVLPRPEAGGLGLLACVVGEPDAEAPGAAELRGWLQERLPSFMVPAGWAFLPSLPLTANGKVDRRALASLRPEQETAAGGVTFEAPRTPTEELVAGIFAEVLSREPVGREDDFFALGGHSLLATRLTSRVRSVLGVELPLRAVFEASTVAGLAGWIEGSKRGEGDPDPLVRLRHEAPPPLSFAQQRLWFLDQLEPGSSLYNIPLKVELRGRLDPGVLSAALDEVVRRHEVLRTRFERGAEGPVQVVETAVPRALALADLGALPQPVRVREEARLTGEEARRPFDLARGPLLRTLLLRRGEDDQALVLSMHHAISDGWSLGVLVRELGLLYPAFLAGRPSPLPEPAIQYADFAVWQRRHLAGERLAAEVSWWRGHLAGMPQALDLPADRPRPAVLSDRGASHHFLVDAETLAGLTRISRRHGATLFMTLLAAFAALLQRVGDGSPEDVGIGSPVAGRTRVETEPLIGFFVNLLVLRVDLAADPDVGTLLGRVRETTLAAYAHQELPFERLVEELAAERDRSRAPLVQVMLALQNAPAGPLELPGLELEAVALPSGTAKLDLTVALAETAAGLRGDVESSRDLFDGATIERMIGHFVRLLDGIVADPQRRLSELPLLSAAERQQTLVEGNDTTAAFPREACLAELFAAVAAARPEDPAIVVPGRGESPAAVWTYGRLAAASNRLARRLQSLGVVPQTPVCIAMERSAELIVGILAIVQAGGLYVPLDAGYPDERLAFMLADVGAEIVLVHAATRERLAGRARQVVVEEDDEADIASDPLGVRVPAESAAYVIYTSGSTGRPKGVAVPQRAIVRLVRETDYVRLGPGDRVAQLASISFDAATWEIWGALLNGATVVVVPREVVLSAPALAALLGAQAITSLFLTTALFNRLAQEAPEAFAGVRDVLFGGEAADPAMARAVLAARPPQRLLHVYGPTESTTFASWHLLRAVPAGASSLPIGGPLANTTLYVADRRLTAVPAGAAGELLIGGDGLAWGYWNRPELTAERFVPDPWTAGGRLYRTGDLVRRPPGGTLEFLSRIDQQVKIRGFRIEPGEIEAALLAHPGVRAAVVLPRREAGGLGLVACVVGEPDAEAPGASELRGWLQERLPSFMVPAGWAFLPSLPLTANGKVDRRALASLRPEREAAAGGGAFQAPRTPTEELVAGIFAEVLSREPVGREDDFFALGGHSLLATQVVSRVRSVLGVDLPLRTVFEASTVAGLAGWIEGSLRGEGDPDPLVRLRHDAPPPLSFAQQRLWFLDQLETGTPLYNVPVAVGLAGNLDRRALAAALGEVVRRHEVLRTAFPAVAGRPVQLVAPAAGFTLPEVDLAGLTAGAREAEEGRLSAAEAVRPFHLGGPGGLLRAQLLRLEPARHVLLLNAHHIVSDGWSTGVLVRELGALYAAFAAGRPSPLADLAIQYADFAVWQRRRLAGAFLEEELAWWRQALAGMPQVLELPTDRPWPPVRGLRGAVQGFAIDAQAAAGLARLSRRQGATLFMTLLAGFAALLQRLTGGEDLAVGTPLAGRLRVETEPLIGLFVNTLAVRVDGSGEPAFVDVLARVRESTLSAFAHQEVPFERLVEDLCLDRAMSRPPLVQVLFALQNVPSPALELPGLALTAAPVPTGTAKLDLLCTLTETPDGLVGGIEYSCDVFDRSTIERLADRFVRLLAAIERDPSGRPAELPLLSAAEQQALLEWNDTATAYPRESSIPALFAALVRAMPEAPAILVPESGQEPAAVWTYGRLDAVSNRLARRLRALGVRPQAPVGLCMERSAELIVGVLAILKAGGMYVPLDPGYPDERLDFMLADCGAEVVLVHAETRVRLAGWPQRLAGLTVVAVDEDDGEGTGDPPYGRVAAESAAYVIYTSGSTGRPKGVVVPHRAVVRLVRDTAYVSLGPGDRVGQVASISFDAATWEIWGALLTGAALVVVPRDVVLSAAALADVLREQRITSLFLTTALFNRMARETPDAFAGLRELLFGGEEADPAAARAVLQAGGPRRLLHVYGPTESTTYASWHPVVEVPEGTASLPIGLPLSNTSLVVLDSRLLQVPIGVAGELCIGGDGLAWCYWNRPELTAERFVPDPRETGARLYRTGDRVRRTAGGAIEFLGRLDRQVKLRGFRIELGEIEVALTALEGVVDAAVVLREDLSGGRGLVAYLVGAPGVELAAAALRRALEGRLPAYMVPAGFVQLAALPLTANGKLDRRWLAQQGPLPDRSAEGGAFRIAPRNPAEEVLAGIFAAILGLESVGAEADFFALGGHSLLATQLVSRVRKAFGVELPLRAVFERSTVAGLAQEVAALRSEETPAVERVERVPRGDEILPPSFAQERLWFLQQLEPGSAAYNMPLELELGGALRLDALAAALTEVLRRHESLRTTFHTAGGVLGQRIAPPVAAAALPLVDLSALPPAVGSAVADGLAQWHAARGLDLERGPLFVWLLVRLAGERHRCLLNLHHTIADGWSIQVLSRELGELYAAGVEGRPAGLPELPIQYADFAHWQRRWMEEKQEVELAYWESRLGGDVAAAELPTDRPRPAIQSFRGGRQAIELSADRTAQLRRFGREEGATLFMTLLAALQVLLARHSGENDVAVGVPVAGRRWAETEGLIGCFLNTLVLRTDTSGEPGFRALVARVRTVTLEAYSHQGVPFEAVLARLGVRRDLSRAPLFQVLFNLLNLPPTAMELPGLELRSRTPAEVPSKLDLTFYVSEGDRIGINLVYNADLFDAARMEDLLAQLDLFLQGALEEPERPVTTLPLLTPAARQVFPDPGQVLDGSWIGGVYELFAATAARVPERVAVADEAGVQTYAGLLAASRRVAGWLAAHGVRPGDPVAILAIRTAPLVEAVLGVLGAGGAFVMLDAAYPALRQLDMLRQACPRAWISFAGEEGAVLPEVRSWLQEARCPCLELPTGGAAALAEPAPWEAEAPQVRVGPGDVACIGFTSGSTGGPKGVLGLHGSLSHFLPTHCRLFDLGPEDRFSLLSGLGHDPLQREIFTPLFLGGTIVVPAAADYGLAGRLAAWLARLQVTVSHLTPTLSQLLTERAPGTAAESAPALRRVLLVGESLTRQDVARLCALAPAVSCVNLYGSTETQRAVAFHRVLPEEADAGRAERAQQVLPLGRGVPDVQLLVLNPAGALAGLGELGEIAVRSPHLARGYLGNAELTAQKFQANPFTTGDPADRMYRTGDLGRYRADGEVVFAGRLDQQVKLRGFRIELGEIEGVLVALPGVHEAVVLLRSDLPGGAGLVAYVRTEEGREATLRGELEARLPVYMVPAAFVRLDRLPRNANGKVDRRALSRIAPELGLPDGGQSLPRTPAEQLLAGIWSQVLGVETVGVEQSFFELGGHSLLATQMASRVRDVFGVELPLRSLFVTPTLAGLAAEIERLRGGDAVQRPTISSFRKDRGSPPPLSFAQERYWAGRHVEARTVASTIPMLIHLEGPLDVPLLQQAIAALVDRHELLRTSFRDGPEGPIQVIHPAAPLELRIVDLEALAETRRMAEARRLSALDGRLPFDYERAPLFRSTLFRLAGEEHVLLFTIHHVASDWWSTPILFREVAALYLALRSGVPSPLPPLAAQFQDFARWQRRLSREEALASQVTFWREHLQGALPLDLCQGRPRPRRRTFLAGSEEVRVPEELERRLDAFSAQQGVTLFMTLQAAFVMLLHGETGQDDLVVPCSFANRNQSETEALIGNLATALPLRTRLAGLRTFRDLLLQVRDVTLLAHDHPDIFWEPVVEGMTFLEEGDRGGLLTFRILFQLLKVPRTQQAQVASDLRINPLPVDTGRMRLDLSLFLSQADRLSGRFRYNLGVLDAARVAAMRDHFLHILAAIVADPECPLAELAIRPVSEVAR